MKNATEGQEIFRKFNDEINELIYSTSSNFRELLDSSGEVLSITQSKSQDLIIYAQKEFTQFFKQFLDNGFIREITYKANTVSPIYMYNRSYFLSEFYYKYLKKTNELTLGVIYVDDILNSFIPVINRNQNGRDENPIDYILSTIAAKIESIKNEVNNNYHIKDTLVLKNINSKIRIPKDIKLEIGRLGGNIFGIYIIQDNKKESKNKAHDILECISYLISTIDLNIDVYKDQKPVEYNVKNINSHFEISSPFSYKSFNTKDSKDRVFKYYLRRALFISESPVSILGNMSPLDFCVKNIDALIDPIGKDEHHLTHIEKMLTLKNISYIAKKFRSITYDVESFSHYYEIAKTLDNLESTLMQRNEDFVKSRRRRIFNYAELRLRNHLLNIYSYKRGDIYRMIEAGKFDSVLCFKLPFMRENNVYGSIPFTDKILISFGEEFKNIISELTGLEKKNIVLAQEGSIFMICFKNITKIRLNIFNKFRNIKEIKPFANNSIKFFIASSFMDLEKQRNKHLKINTIFDKIFDDTEDELIQKMLEIINEKIDLFEKNFQNSKELKISLIDYEKVKIEDYIFYYLENKKNLSGIKNYLINPANQEKINELININRLKKYIETFN